MTKIHLRASIAACVLAALAVSTKTGAMGKPGVTPVPCPTQEWQLADAAFEPLAGAKAFFGKSDGGLYRIEIPENWNGELVLYAHGFVSNAGTNGSTLRVQNHTIREHLVKSGFAWAASSYRCNGYVPGIGLQDTMALVDLFTTHNGGHAPQRTYLTGTSMGGHVTLLGMQEFPTSFAGGLAMCPAGPELFDYFAAVSAAAEVITGIQFTKDTLQQDAARMSELLGRPPDYTDKGRQLASVEIQISGGPRPFAMEGLASRFLANMSTSHAALTGSTTPTNRALTTSHIKYGIDPGLGLTADELNARVRRKAADPEMRNPNGPYEEVVPFDGKIARPVLTMHGTGDLFVPVFLQQALKRAVIASGNERWLVQRLYRIGAHCQFSQAEQIRAFDDLVKWVRQGSRPEGDQVYGDLSDAGRTFTDPLRPNDPGTLTVPAKAPSSPQPAAARVDFVRDVQPIFRQHCIGCHGPTIHQNGLRLDRRHNAMRGGTGPVIGPGNSAGSRLYFQLIGNTFGPQMPPTGALPPEEIATIKAWIDQGAEWPDEASGETPVAPPDPFATQLIAALRRSDLNAFTTLARTNRRAGDLRGPRGDTLLMQAVLYGDVDSMRLLLDNGADPNARNEAGATALMWAVNDLDKTRLLLEYGADVTARSDNGRTAIIIAAGRAGNAPVVRLLLDYGADPSDKGPGANTVFESMYRGDEETFRTLIAAGASPANVGYGTAIFALRNGCRACAELVASRFDRESLDGALLFAGPPIGDARTMAFFLERGANVDAKTSEGRTALMLAASSDLAPVDVVKLLIDRGADVNASTPSGETALSMARLRGRTPVVDVLVAAGARGSDTAAPPPAFAPAGSPRAAVERSLPLLQQSDAIFLKKSGCVSCHNNTLTAMTVAAARAKGIKVDESIARQQVAGIAAFLEGWRDRVLQGIGIPGDQDTVSSILAGLAAERFAPNDATDAMATFLRRQQAPAGNWRIVAHRPPLESDDLQVTALTMRALQVYAPASERAAYDRTIQRAAAWLATAEPTNTEARAYQLLGLGWSGSPKEQIRRAARALAAEQRADGGWAQLQTLTSDAYATGQALVALVESGAFTPADDVYQRGVRYLLSTQLADGSWRVRTRAIALQPLFESGFPHGRDQWISAAATNWAALALTLATPNRS